MSDDDLTPAKRAAYAYFEGMFHKADGFHGSLPLWHGWALRDAFEAGAAFAAIPAADPLADPRVGAEALRRDPVIDLNAEALAEVKATLDGKSDQTVREIMDGLLAEIAALTAIQEAKPCT